MCLSAPPGLGGLEEAPGLAGGTPGGEVRRLGPPAGGPTHKTIWKPPPGGRHQDLLVRHNILVVGARGGGPSQAFRHNSGREFCFVFLLLVYDRPCRHFLFVHSTTEYGK